MKLTFTKLGTVKCSEFELTKKDFFRKMTSLIMDNPNIHNVSYDKKSDTYEVMYNSNKFEVKYGNEYLSSDCSDQSLVSCLNQLVAISTIQKTLCDEEKELNKQKEKKEQKLMENAKNNVLKTNEDKLAKIDLLRKEDKEKGTKSLEETVEFILDINYGELGFFTGLGRMGTGIISIILFLAGVVHFISGGVAFLATVPLFAYIGTGLGLIDAIFLLISFYNDSVDDEAYRGLVASAFSLLLAPFALAVFGVKRVINKIKLKREINKIRKTLAVENNIKSREVQDKGIEIVDKMLSETKDENNNTNDVLMSFKEFDELKNSILLINDEKTKKEYANELYKILEYCIKITKLKDRDKAYTVLLNELSKLKMKVNNKIEEEENQKNGFYKLMSEIDEKIEETKNDEEYERVMVKERK
jgi:hypothetical protein